MKNDSIYVPAHTAFARVDGTIVLAQLHSGRYYGLDATGSLFWETLITSGSVSAALDRLKVELKIPYEILERDLVHLAQDWLDLGLLRANE